MNEHRLKVMQVFANAYNNRRVMGLEPYLTEDFKYGCYIWGTKEICTNKKQFLSWLNTNLLNVAAAGTVKMKTEIMPLGDDRFSNIILVVESITPFLIVQDSYLVITFTGNRASMAYLAQSGSVMVPRSVSIYGANRASEMLRKRELEVTSISQSDAQNMRYRNFDNSAVEWVKKQMLEADGDWYFISKLIPTMLQNCLNLGDVSSLLPYIDDNVVCLDTIENKVVKGKLSFEAFLNYYIGYKPRARQSDNRYVLIKAGRKYFILSDFEFNEENGKLLNLSLFSEDNLDSDYSSYISSTLNVVKSYIDCAM